MINSTIFIGEPLVFQGAVAIYPPTVKEVITNSMFNTFLKLLTVTSSDLQEELQLDKSVEPLDFLLANCYQDKRVLALAEKAFDFFCHVKIEPLYNDRGILLINEQGGHFLLNERNYFAFQNAIRAAIGEKELESEQPIDPDEDPRIRKIKERAKQRDRIKAKQARKNGISLSTILTAICCMGIGITPLNIGEMSYASLGPIMNMMQDKEKYDIDIRSLLAGADSKKVKPKYWIRKADE